MFICLYIDRGHLQWTEIVTIATIHGTAEFNVDTGRHWTLDNGHWIMDNNGTTKDNEQYE